MSKHARLLGLDPEDPSTRDKVDAYLSWCASKGLDSETAIGVSAAAAALGVSSRTVRRWIAAGELDTERVRSKGTLEHRIGPWTLWARQTESGSSRPRTAVEELADALRSSEADRAEMKALLRDQGERMAKIEGELRDARGEIHQLSERLVKALDPPKRKERNGFLKWLLERDPSRDPRILPPDSERT